MLKEIKVSYQNQFTQFLDMVLVPGDANVYKIVYRTPFDLTGVQFKITAVRHDKTVITDTGTVSGTKAEYVIKNNIYAVKGELLMRLTLINGDEVLTNNEIILPVADNIAEANVSASNEITALITALSQVGQMKVKVDEAYKNVANLTVSAVKLASNESSYVAKQITEDGNVNLEFGIPKGADGNGLTDENLAVLKPMFDGYGYSENSIFIANFGLIVDKLLMANKGVMICEDGDSSLSATLKVERDEYGKLVLRIDKDIESVIGGVTHKLSEKANSAEVYKKVENVGINDEEIVVAYDLTGKDSSVQTKITPMKVEVGKNLEVGCTEFFLDSEITLGKYGDDGVEFHYLSKKADKSYVDEKLGDVEAALDELHAYAQALISGGAEV